MKSYPTIKLISKGRVMEYQGERKSQAFVDISRKLSYSEAIEIESLSQLLQLKGVA